MKRRSVVKGLILFSLGTGMIFSCKDKYKAIRDLNLDHFKPTNEELDIIGVVSEMIVPLASIPQMADHTPLPFIFTMIDDVYSPEDREVFQNGYKTFDTYAESREGKRFSKMSNEEKENFMILLNNRHEGIDSDVQSFYDMVKNESIHYLRSSEFYQRKVNYYEMAPGRHKGNVSIDELKNANEV